MPVKAGLPSAKAWLRGPFVCNSLSAMADSNSCALVIRLRKDKRVVWPYLKKRSIDDNLRQLVLITQDRVLLN